MERDNNAVCDSDDPPFDFHARVGRSKGARIEIAPGNIEPDEAKFVNLDERPFWLIESFVCTHLKEPRIFSHHGKNTIPISAWVDALNDARTAFETVNDASKLGDLWMRRGYHELANEFINRPNLTLEGFRDLVSGLIEQTASWTPLYRSVFIFGI